MQTVFKCGRALIALGAFFGAGGCINLPPAVEREFECPAAGAPDNFGSASACVPSSR
jgi:hypothetical protein